MVEFQKCWELKVDENKNIRLWPPSFYRMYYRDDLSENVPEIVEDFQRVKALIEKENLLSL